MQTTIKDIERHIPPRPTSNDDVTIAKTAEKILPGVLRWLAQANGKEDDRPEEVLEDLRDVLRGTFDLDGYSLVKELDSHHYWSADSGLVEELDQAFHFVMEAVDELTRIWVKDNGVTTTHAVGDTVYVQDRGQWHSGEVTTLDPDLAKMVVYVEALGHVRRESGKCGTTGISVAYENVRSTPPGGQE